MNLLRLAEISGRTEWREKARRTFAAFGAHLASDPETYPLASALDFDFAPARHVPIAGDRSSRDTRELLEQVNRRSLPNVILLFADGGADQEQLARWLPFVAGARRINRRATAYICDSLVCKLPTTDPKVEAPAPRHGTALSGVIPQQQARLLPGAKFRVRALCRYLRGSGSRPRRHT
jgi:uncharacterized protein YyaL (SSP411 family)